MAEKLARYLTVGEAAEALATLAQGVGATEFVQVRNLNYVFAPHELYALAPRVEPPLPRIAAFAVDMDGTSTTTEPLALHSLEYMIRRITGRMTKSQWPGLDPVRDYPYVIGNSNFRHTEFLVQRYGDAIDQGAFTRSFIEALLWTLACMTDEHRRRDITLNARNAGLGGLLADGDFQRLAKGGQVSADNVATLAESFVKRFGASFRPQGPERIATALDVYYLRYHAILREMEHGRGEALAVELLGAGGQHLVEPMPGYDVFLPLVQGWLGAEADALYEPLRAHLLAHPELGHTATELDRYRGRLGRLAIYFQRHPARVALVTASIAYETHACMKEVIRVVAQRVQNWPVPAAVKERLAANLVDYRAVFSGFACATDVWEARLKPHRDLYALALFQMSIPKSDYRYCVGLEDTEPGVISLRAAGIGCAIALPNHDTRRQDNTAAAKVVHGGLPELMLVHNLLLDEAAVA